jgi:hypothetical protein
MHFTMNSKVLEKLLVNSNGNSTDFRIELNFSFNTDFEAESRVPQGGEGNGYFSIGKHVYECLNGILYFSRVLRFIRNVL